MYRETDQQPIELCVECPADATARCPRCEDPCCAAHVYSVEGLCRECETERLRRGDTDRVGRRLAIAIGSAVATGLLIFPSWLAVYGGVFVAVVATLVFGLVVGTPAEQRRRFLAEVRDRRQRPLLEEKTGGVTPPG